MTTSAIPYVQKQTFRSMLAGVVELFVRHWLTMTTIMAVGALGGAIILGLMAAPFALDRTSTIAHVVGAIMLLLVGYGSVFVVTAAMTVAISEAALGNRPSVLRAYRRVLAPETLGNLAKTYVLQSAIVFAGMLLCVLPGLWLGFRYLLAPTVVVLEHVGGMNALRRSGALSRSRLLRVIKFMLIYWLFSIPFGVALSLSADRVSLWIQLLLLVLTQLVVLTITSIVIVLIYYDLRSHQEGYDIRLLAEDLRQ